MLEVILSYYKNSTSKMLRTAILLVTLLFAAASISLLGRILDKSYAKTGVLTLAVSVYDPLMENG